MVLEVVAYLEGGGWGQCGVCLAARLAVGPAPGPGDLGSQAPIRHRAMPPAFAFTRAWKSLKTPRSARYIA